MQRNHSAHEISWPEPNRIRLSVYSAPPCRNLEAINRLLVAATFDRTGLISNFTAMSRSYTGPRPLNAAYLANHPPFQTFPTPREPTNTSSLRSLNNQNELHALPVFLCSLSHATGGLVLSHRFVTRYLGLNGGID
jgi:hypothetical protein